MKFYPQTQFISNWNAIVDMLSLHPRFNKLPNLSAEGVCAGFSFVLAEHIREGKEDKFYKWYNLICATNPKDLTKVFLLHDELSWLTYKLTILNNKNPITKDDWVNIVEYEARRKNLTNIIKKSKRLSELFSILNYQERNQIIDFIYKIYVLEEKQKELQVELSAEEMQKLSLEEIKYNNLLQNMMSSENHRRIGNIIPIEEVEGVKYVKDVGALTWRDNYIEKLTLALKTLNEKESLEIGIYGTSGAHSILAYRKNNQYHVFDSATGKNKAFATAPAAASKILYISNKFETLGTGKYNTPFERLWNKSKLLTIVLFPISIVLLFHDAFLAKYLSKEKLKSQPVNKAMGLTWGKIKAKNPNHNTAANNVQFSAKETQTTLSSRNANDFPFSRVPEKNFDSNFNLFSPKDSQVATTSACRMRGVSSQFRLRKS